MHVTVAIPCFNGVDYLARTIESVLSQSCEPDMVVVVDDGSVDASAEVAERYPVTLIRHHRNQGLASARNTALSVAPAGILAFIDADARAGTYWLEALLSGYDASRIAGVGGRGIEVEGNSLADVWRRRHAAQDHGSRPRTVRHLFGLSMSYRVDVLREIGGFNPAFRTNAEDVDVGLRLNASGYLLRYLPSAKVYHQRVDNEESLLRTMAAWYRFAYYARRLNKHAPWKLFLGTIRRAVTDPIADILLAHNVALASLSLRVSWIKLRALMEAEDTYPEFVRSLSGSGCKST